MSFVKEISIVNRNKMTAEGRKKASALIEAAHKEDSRLVKGMFKNMEAPGMDVEFAYRLYKGEPIQVYTLEDGKEYTLPLGVAKHINKRCKYKKHKYLVDAEGKSILAPDKPYERYQFVSTDFM